MDPKVRTQLESSQGEGDISHDGRRIALAESGSPRWSPDDRWIAFVGAIEIAFNRAIYVMDAGDGEPKASQAATCIEKIPIDGGPAVRASRAHDLPRHAAQQTRSVLPLQ